jgi:tetratricopeptide (TPR) repeat protein
MRAFLPALLAITTAASGAAVALRPRQDWEESARVAAIAMAGADAARRVRDQDIGFFEARVGRDPTGALDLIQLGGLFLRRFGDAGDERDLVAAEQAARRSLDNRSRRNAPAWQLLTAALLGQHRFVEARVAAERLVAANPEDAVAHATLGEVLLELGEYPEADRVFRRLQPRRFEAALAPRYARWLEIRGQAGAARRLLETARDHAARAGDVVPVSQRAWYELRLGELALRFGAHREAARRIAAGLALVPDDWRLLAASARLSLATGDPDRTIALGDSSLSRHLDPATLAAVGDAWLRKGDPARAEEYFRAMESMSRAPSGGFHRAWYFALLNHGRRIPELLAAVQRDLETRRDVYGYDLLAWALFKSGRVAEARAAMGQALAWGTEDPELRARARAIDAAQ